MTLLRQYSTERREAAFNLLVERYSPSVYSAAFRLVGRDSQMAEDVTQHVFAELAHCAAEVLRRGAIVSGWLLRTTRFTAAKLVRTEKRRRAREATAASEMQTSSRTETDALDWDTVASHLDEAMNELRQSDRQAILLRFSQGLDFRALGPALNISDDTAQKRVTRAIEKLRQFLRGRGVILPGSLLCALVLASEAAMQQFCNL